MPISRRPRRRRALPANPRPRPLFRCLALIAVVLIAGCSRTDDGPSAAAVPVDKPPLVDDTLAAAPPPDTTRFDLEGGVTIAIAAPPLAFDPHRTVTRGDNIFISMAYDRLTELSNTLEVVPLLATEWAYSDDGTTFDMTLREGVVFHDGTPFDAAAVVANIERAKTVEGSVVAPSLADVTSVEALDTSHVRFNLDGGPSNLPELLSGLAGAMISPAAIADPTVDLATASTDAGAGPYRLTEWEPGQFATFEQAPDYWDPPRQRAGRIRLQFVADEQAQLDGMAAGEFDVIQVTGDLVAQAITRGDAGEFRYLPQVPSTVQGLMLNPTKGDLQSTEVRRAIQLGIDRNVIVDDVLGGYCENRGQPFALGSAYFFPELERNYLYDPDEARSLLATSGIEEPTFDVLAPPGIYLTVAETMSRQLAEVGITMNVVPSDIGSAVGAFATGEAEAVSLAIVGYPDPAQLLDQVYFRLGTSMFPPGDTELQERAAAASSLDLSPSERLDAYRQLFTDIAERSVFIPACAATNLWAWQPDIVGVDSMPNLYQGVVFPYTVGLVDRG